jgi:DNA-directed RNA polymerase subunit K/omega
MDYKKSKAATTSITRDIDNLDKDTDNIYQTVMIIARRANQISVEIKQELNRKLEEFASYTDNLEEVFENREQIEISRFYERLAKSTLIATEEFIDEQIYYRLAEVQEES